MSSYQIFPGRGEYSSALNADPWRKLMQDRARQVAGSTTKKKAPKKTTSSGAPSDPYKDTTAQIDAMIATWVTQVQQQQAQARAQAEAEAAQELAKGQALAEGLKQLGISGAIQSIFQNAGNNQAALASGFSGQIRDQAAAQAAEQQRMLSGTGQEGAVRQQGENMGNVQYGLGGQIPASTLNTQGANFAAEAALQPGFALEFAQLAQQQRMNDYVKNELPDFTQQISDIYAKRPELLQDSISDLQKQATKSTASTKLQKVTFADGTVQYFDPMTGKPASQIYGDPRAPSAKSEPKPKAFQAKPYGDGRYVTYDPNTGQTVGEPWGKVKPTKSGSKSSSSKGYNLQLKTVGNKQAWFDPRSGKRVSEWMAKAARSTSPKTNQRPDGMTSTQVRAARGEAYSVIKAWKANGMKDGEGNAVKPSDLLKELINEGQIPFDIAVRQLAKFYKPASKWFKNETKANSAKTNQNAALVEDAMDTGPRSGIKYVFGGAGQGGYDCSGYTMDMVAKHTGVQLPHQARAQFYDSRGQSVPKGGLQPGDVVFFRSSPNGQGDGPPYHCGYYIGNGKYVEYYSSGKPARVSSLSSRSDYMGARRFGGTRA